MAAGSTSPAAAAALSQVNKHQLTMLLTHSKLLSLQGRTVLRPPVRAPVPAADVPPEPRGGLAPGAAPAQDRLQPVFLEARPRHRKDRGLSRSGCTTLTQKYFFESALINSHCIGINRHISICAGNWP